MLKTIPLNCIYYYCCHDYFLVFRTGCPKMWDGTSRYADNKILWLIVSCFARMTTLTFTRKITKSKKPNGWWVAGGWWVVGWWYARQNIGQSANYLLLVLKSLWNLVVSQWFRYLGIGARSAQDSHSPISIHKYICKCVCVCVCNWQLIRNIVWKWQPLEIFQLDWKQTQRALKGEDCHYPSLPFPSLYSCHPHVSFFWFSHDSFPRGGAAEGRRRWDSLAGRKTLKADKSFRLPCHTENKCKLRCCRLPKTFDRKGKTTTTPEEKQPTTTTIGMAIKEKQNAYIN